MTILLQSLEPLLGNSLPVPLICTDNLLKRLVVYCVDCDLTLQLGGREVVEAWDLALLGEEVSKQGLDGELVSTELGFRHGDSS
jgi:hypothetical protein